MPQSDEDPSYQSVFDVIRLAFSKEKKKKTGAKVGQKDEKPQPHDELEDEDEENGW